MRVTICASRAISLQVILKCQRSVEPKIGGGDEKNVIDNDRDSPDWDNVWRERIGRGGRRGIDPAALKQSRSNRKQASGGAGSIFNLAKQNLGAQDFTQVANAVPDIDKMMAAAPKVDGVAGMVGGVSSLLGGRTQSVSGVANLAGSFSQLGMNGVMVNSFIPIILNYVKSSGGDPVMNILQSALK